jgi:hypothetical protein
VPHCAQRMHPEAKQCTPTRHSYAIRSAVSEAQTSLNSPSGHTEGEGNVTLMNFLRQDDLSEPVGSRDGDGAGDHDQPYRFGARPRSNVTYPFNTRQYARLLVLRGRVQDRRIESEIAELSKSRGGDWRDAA